VVSRSGYNGPQNIAGFIPGVVATATGGLRVLPLVTTITSMKTDDLSFKFVAAIVLAGVIIALISPAHPPASAAAPVAQAASPAHTDTLLDETLVAPDVSVSE
jgi:hypothetical protein